ncbi:MAG: AAA family ATPase, partial [Acidobacteriota bacterium]|nr:AAA family ATPase [Acidobacteriota bacterium]
MPLFDQTEPETCDITVERIVFQNAESGWTVARIRLEGSDAPATAVGRLFGVDAGQRLQITGDWVRDRKYGRQLRIRSFLALDPTSLRGLERYLGSGLLPGVGKVTAHRLVERFGEETLEILDTSPARLREVSGIGPARASKIASAWQQKRQQRDAMIFLQGHDISPRFAARILKRFGDDTVTEVTRNPYRLAEEISGIGFAAADRVAKSLGWAPEAMERIAGGVLYALRDATTRGHVFLPLGHLVERTCELLEVDANRVQHSVPDLERRRAIVLDGPPGDERRVYLPELMAAESGIRDSVERLLARPVEGPTIAVDKALRWFEARSGLQLATAQREAIAKAFEEKILVLTGGPGTGKTTLMRAVVEILEAKGLTILLAAPTGRAANRLGEATGREVKTIHR